MKVQVLAIPQTILFPGSIVRLSAEALDSKKTDDKILVVPKLENGSLSTYGTVANRLAIPRQESVLLEGLYRAKIQSVQQSDTGLDIANVEKVKDSVSSESRNRVELKLDKLKGLVKRLLDLSGADGASVMRKFVSATAASTVNSPGKLADILASVLPLDFDAKLKILSTTDVDKRLDLITEMVQAQTESMRKAVVKRPSQSASVSPSSDGDSEDSEVAELEHKLGELDLTADARRVVNRELKRLKRMHPSQAEYQVCRTYLETISEIPWSTQETEAITRDKIESAREILDAEHYGLEKVKKRLVEYLAVMYLRQEQAKRNPKTTIEDKAPILLLVGPPGVGKTSLAKSVARALDRKLHRISLGGVRDEAEIRGHRRTYVGAMPGLLVQGLRKVGVVNPVMVLDEIDKIGQGNNFHGDPSAAMLEVLDPEQNYSFNDHYINFPIDLSKTLFIATANSTDTIPGPLLDRMETIRIDGYTYMEKQHIAQRYLIPKQIRSNGVEPGTMEVPDKVLHTIATKYTREAGVRELERQVATLIRGKAVEQLQSNKKAKGKVIVKESELEKYLGLEKYHDDVVNDEVDEYADKNGVIHRRQATGVVNGLAYMGTGNGGLLTFEATKMKGKGGNLKMTGKLGDVISESGQIALSWVRANASRLGIEDKVFTQYDIHIHAPAGAIPKDGPSAGMAMTMALVSLLCDRTIPGDIAMTGEMTLRGKILPVGGVREKLLGAHMAGIKRVLLPFHLSKVVRDECKFIEETGMEIIYVKYIWDAIRAVWGFGDAIVLDSNL
uniref:Lon protease homolog n=1 Tax=Blastobotrys adeninivorans TaxID=409370 RepID=A0A060T5V1_BLAAD